MFNRIPLIRNVSKYFSVAIGSALVDWVVFFLCHWMGFGPINSQMAARISGGIFSFMTNRHWTFAGMHTGQLTTQGRRFFTLYLFSYILSISLMHFLININHIPTLPSKLAADSICLVVNFLVMQRYVFKDHSGLMAKLYRLIKSIF